MNNNNITNPIYSVEARDEVYSNVLRELTLNTNIPSTIEMELSKDRSCINIRNTEFKVPITFNISIKPENFPVLYQYPRVDDLLNRYRIYDLEYKKIIVEYSIAEREFLQTKFPNLVFNLKIREKSEFSYKKKLNDKLSKDINYNPYIHDIIGERIIVSQLDNRVPVPATEEEFEKTDYENKLISVCFDISEALSTFRKNTVFQLVEAKNYISNPKVNGYQSIHHIMMNTSNTDLKFETQIRTLTMEEKAKKDDKLAHSTYKPRLLNEYSILKLPKYISISPFCDSNGVPIAYEIPQDNNFYHFYGVSYESYRKQLDTLLPYIQYIKDILYVS